MLLTIGDVLDLTELREIRREAEAAEFRDGKLTAGMAAGFPAGVADGHCLINRSDAEAVVLEVGDRHERPRLSAQSDRCGDANEQGGEALDHGRHS